MSGFVLGPGAGPAYKFHGETTASALSTSLPAAQLITTKVLEGTL